MYREISQIQTRQRVNNLRLYTNLLKSKPFLIKCDDRGSTHAPYSRHIPLLKFVLGLDFIQHLVQYEGSQVRSSRSHDSGDALVSRYQQSPYC